MDSNTTGPKPRSHVFGYLDETGLLTSPNDRFFGMGLLVVQSPRAIHRSILRLKDKRHYYRELKFEDVQPANLPIYRELIDIALATHGLRFNCYIVDKQDYSSGNHVGSYNGYAGYLIANTIDQADEKTSEYITILADDVSTNDKDDHFEHMVRDRIRSVTRRNALFGICRLESHAVSEIQLTDVLVGTTNYAFKMREGLVSTRGPKAQLVKYLQVKLNVSLLAETQERKMRNKVYFSVVEK
jgi:hypothetical protein